MPKAYMVGFLRMRDPSWRAEYGPKTADLIEKHGGHYVVRSTPTIKEGKPAVDFVVVVEFPSRAAAEAWYADPDYQPMIALRQGGSELDFVLVDGVD